MKALDRPRLLARINEATSARPNPARAIVLCAPAGYGKSRLASVWLREQAPGRVVQLNCANDSVDTLWRDIVDLLELTTDSTRSVTDRESRFSALQRLVCTSDEPVTLVLENYENATSPENDMALLELAGPKLMIIVCAQRVSVLNGPLAASHEQMLYLGVSDLALTYEEAHQYIGELDSPWHEQLEAAIEVSRGWPRALRAAVTPIPGGSASTGESSGTGPQRGVQPFAALNLFSLHHLEIVSPLAQQLLLATSLVDAMSYAQAMKFSGASEADTRAAINELVELGPLTLTLAEDTDHFSCHPAVQPSLAARAEREFSSEQRIEVLRDRASEIAPTTPLTAMQLYLKAPAYADAELVLASHFTTITDEAELCAPLLRALPETVLAEHPTFIAARLFLDLPDSTVPPTTLGILTGIWYRSLKELLKGAHVRDEMRTPYIAQTMVAARLSGDFAFAKRLSHELEARLTMSHEAAQSAAPHFGYGARHIPGSGAYPMYIREAASTALMSGDFDRARRGWELLKTHADRLIEHPWYGFPTASSRTITDPESGRRWRLAALHEQAFTELLDNNLQRAADYLEEADTYSRDTATLAPGVAWVSGEIVRAHLAAEWQRPELLERAQHAIEPLRDRLEQWCLLLIAEAEVARYQRGASAALFELESELEQSGTSQNRIGVWRNRFAVYHARLNTIVGRFSEAERILDTLDESHSYGVLERARLALFSGEDLLAYLLAQSVSEPAGRKGRTLVKSLITACAAWGCGQKEEAVEILQRVAVALEEQKSTANLWNVPFDTLVEIASEAGLIALLQTLESVPTPARAKRYERLTEMEQHTLEAFAAHKTINETAAALFVTPATVKKHLNAVYRKLDARGRDEAILQASRMGIIQAPGRTAA